MDPTQSLINALSGRLDGNLLSPFDLLESACEGSLVVDQHCRVVWISEQYRQLLGLAPDLPMLGREVEQFIPNSLMRQVVESGQPQLLDLMRFGDRWFVVTRLPLKDRQGQTLGAIGFVFYQQLEYLRPLVDKFTRLHHPRPDTSEQRTTRYSFDDLMGSSPSMLGLRQQALRAAQIDRTVLLLGETGTGKEVLAQALHAASPRAKAPFVGVNTAALPESLVEVELFGAAPGAYTGADRKGRKGKFEAAQGGTLFLDEIGDMSAEVQSKLLRVLQEREIEPLGSNRIVPVDVRVIAATSRDLPALVANGQFRADLYYRLNVLQLTLPPLRERLDDLPLLCEHLNARIAGEFGIPAPQIGDALIQAFRGYHWPGNVRELRNVLERAQLFADGGQISVDTLEGFLPHTTAPVTPTAPPAPGLDTSTSVQPLAVVLAEAERVAIHRAIAHCGGNKSQAARLLGISRATLYEKLQRLSS